mmetsp:Transcript_10846/g.32478  ORF Transcript_10846/g.32478 Transcript_10846/m.32478 type:complete len:266 (+) Transcript_10846:217-1014(+)
MATASAEAAAADLGDGEGFYPSARLAAVRAHNRALKKQLGGLRVQLQQLGGRKKTASRQVEGHLGPSRKDFDAAKARILTGLQAECPDNSKKGNVDAPIEGLLGYLNALPDFVSTSSCSGRVAVFCEAADHKKQTGHWAFVSHDVVPDLSPVLEVIRRSATKWATATLKFEPLVLHISCASLSQAQRLVKVVLACGYKNSGMLVGKRVIVAVRSTLKLDIPVAMGGALVVSDAYLLQVLRLANEKMEENFRRTDAFFEALKAEFG